MILVLIANDEYKDYFSVTTFLDSQESLAIDYALLNNYGHEFRIYKATQCELRLYKKEDGNG